MKIIQVEEQEAYRLKEHAGEAARHLGKMMEYLYEICQRGGGGQMGERFDDRGMMDRGGFGMRGGQMGERWDNYGQRWDDHGDRRGGRF